MKPCSRCGVEDRYPGQRWGKMCMGSYVAARRQLARQAVAMASRTDIPPADGFTPRLRPAELPEAVLGLLGPEDQEVYRQYVLAQTAAPDMLRHLLRLGLGTVRARGWAR